MSQDVQIRGVAASSNQLVDDTGDTFEFPNPHDVILKHIQLEDDQDTSALQNTNADNTKQDGSPVQGSAFAPPRSRVPSKIYTLREAIQYHVAYGPASLRIALRETYKVDPLKQQFRDRDIERLVTFIDEQIHSGATTSLAQSEHAKQLLLEIQESGAKAMGKDPTTMRAKLEKETCGADPFLNALASGEKGGPKNGGRQGGPNRKSALGRLQRYCAEKSKGDQPHERGRSDDGEARAARDIEVDLIHDELH